MNASPAVLSSFLADFSHYITKRPNGFLSFMFAYFNNKWRLRWKFLFSLARCRTPTLSSPRISLPTASIILAPCRFAFFFLGQISDSFTIAIIDFEAHYRRGLSIGAIAALDTAPREQREFIFITFHAHFSRAQHDFSIDRQNTADFSMPAQRPPRFIPMPSPLGNICH